MWANYDHLLAGFILLPFVALISGILGALIGIKLTNNNSEHDWVASLLAVFMMLVCTAAFVVAW